MKRNGKKGGSSGHKHKHGKKGGRYRVYSMPIANPEHPLVTATKQAQNLMKIIEALPDQETKDLAMELYKDLGELE